MTRATQHGHERHCRITSNVVMHTISIVAFGLPLDAPQKVTR